MRTQIATIVVVSLVLLAGCNAFGGGNPTSTPTTVPKTTSAPPDPTTTEQTDEPVYDAPLDAATVAANHEAAIRDAGTFTLVSTANQSQGDLSGVVETSVAVDLATGAFFATQFASSRTAETYGHGNGTAYQRLEAGENQTEYVIPQQPPNATQFAGGDVESFVAAFEFDHVGTETVDGTETDVYAASGVEAINESAPGFADLGTENISSIDARVYVADDGLLTQFEYSLTATTGNDMEMALSVQQRYTAVGSTTVEEPSWLDAARDNATHENATA